MDPVHCRPQKLLCESARILCVALSLLVGMHSARSGTTPVSVVNDGERKPHSESAASGPGLSFSSKRTLVLAPDGELYPPYIADPYRPRFALQRMSFSNSEIADAGTSRFGLKAGGRAGVFRLHPNDEPDRGWQFSVQGGFYGQFDNDHSQDNIGWDGSFGLIGAYRSSKTLALKFSAQHISSHIGDEHAERTGRRRINYTRTELVAGASWSIGERWRTYVEAGWGYDLRNDELQEPGRAQFGFEYEADNSLWKRRLGWYAAVDASTFEERSWNVNTNAQVGLVFRAGARHWRLGIEHYDGRSLIGEFFQDDERYTALSLWLDR